MKSPISLKGLTRFDANETLFFSRQLETVDPVNYMTLFAGLLGRRFIPRVENVSPLDNTYTYRMYTITEGVDQILAPSANDHPVVKITAEEVSTMIKQIPVSYGWSVREIQQAAKSGVALDQMTIQAAMSKVARKQDNMLATGLAGTNIKGLLNYPGVLSTTPSTKTGAGAGTKWIRTVAVSPAEIISDINLLISETRNALKQASKTPGGDDIPAFGKFTILLDSLNYAYIASTPRSDNSDTTILQYVLRNNPWIESIEEWWQCDLADTEGDGPRAVCYPRDPMCLGGLIPDDWSSLAPQEVGQDIVVPANGSCGGTVIRYVVAVRYMETI